MKDENMFGESFLNRLYKDLHMSDEVMHTATPQDNKDEKVRKYLERLKKTENLAKTSKKNGMERLKRMYYTKYVIKEENIPESYFELQKKIALERGMGHIEIDTNTRKEMISNLLAEQKKSLEVWLDYLMSDDALYPEWFKYYAFQGMLKLGTYDKEKGSFNKRTSSTTNIFVDLNREALSLTYDNLCKVLEGRQINDNSLKILLENGSFSKIYSYFIQKLEHKNKFISDRKDGIWIKYNQGDSPDALVKSLEGKGTGWCTAGYETAKLQLQGGDFYVYYTKDSAGEYTQPRIAIRMEGTSIGEIRGISKHQNLESEMEEVLEEKLEEFPDKDKYQKKVRDMERLTKIYNEHTSRELTTQELVFLYEIDEEIEGFGYGEDPRINEILDKRNLKKDLALIFNCSEKEISCDEFDFYTGKKIVYFYGSLDLGDLKTVEGLTLPESVSGDLNLIGLEDAKGLKLPKSVGGDLELRGLTTAKDLTLPKRVGGSIDLGRLIIAEGLTLPKRVGGDLDLGRLIIAEGLTLPESVDGDLNLGSLETAKGLTLPKSVGGYLKLEGLETAKNLTLPESVGGFLYLDNLTIAEGLTLPKSVGDALDLRCLTTAKNLTLPESVGDYLDLGSLETAEGLTLPKSVGGYLNLRGLETAEGLTLPKSVGGYLDLDNLTTTIGLNVPKDFCYHNFVSNYISIDDLISKSLENNEHKTK